MNQVKHASARFTLLSTPYLIRLYLGIEFDSIYIMNALMCELSKAVSFNGICILLKLYF